MTTDYKEMFYGFQGNSVGVIFILEDQVVLSGFYMCSISAYR